MSEWGVGGTEKSLLRRQRPLTPGHPLYGWEGATPTKDSAEWERLVRALEKHHRRPICGCESKRTGFPCEGVPARRPDGSYSTCRVHGGTGGVGVAATAYRGKGHSRYQLSGRLAADFEAARSDPDLLSLVDNLATVEALLRQEMAVLDDPAEPPAPLDPATHSAEDVAARHAEIMAYYEVRQAAYRRFRELTQDRNRLTRTETHRVKLAQDTVSGQQVRLFSQAVLDHTRVGVLEYAEKVEGHISATRDALAGVMDRWQVPAEFRAEVLEQVKGLGQQVALKAVGRIQERVFNTIATVRGENMPADRDG